MSARALILCTIVLAGCTVDPAVLGDRACDPQHGCLPGFTCQVAWGRCVPLEGAECSPEGLVLPCGREQGQCRLGSQRCTNGVWQACQGVEPTAERCNGLDDDCDGATDETFAGLGEPCALFVGADPAYGRGECDENGDRVVCAPHGEIPVEVCDGEDNDGSGVPDDRDDDNDGWWACSTLTGVAD